LFHSNIRVFKHCNYRVRRKLTTKLQGKCTVWKCKYALPYTSSVWLNIGLLVKDLHCRFDNSQKIRRLPDPVPLEPKTNKIRQSRGFSNAKAKYSDATLSDRNILCVVFEDTGKSVTCQRTHFQCDEFWCTNYLCFQDLRAHGMCREAFHLVVRSVVIAKLSYAASDWWVSLHILTVSV